MASHTISSSISSQGLGIYSSTLSPANPHRFTGAGYGPNSQPIHKDHHSNQHCRSTPSPKVKMDSQSSSPTRAQPLFQPTFSLRPTHTREGFNTFSAIPPSPNTRPDELLVLGTSTEGARSGSPADVERSGSTSSRKIRPSKSSELLQKWTKRNDGFEEQPTTPYGSYQHIPDEVAAPQLTPRRARSGTVSTVDKSPSSSSHSVFYSDLFPMPPPSRLPRTQSTPIHLHVVPESEDENRSRPQSLQPSQSYHQHYPDLHSQQRQRTQQPQPYFSRPDETPLPQRLSDPLAAHSRNFALFSAETGGMVSCSPSGIYRPAVSHGMNTPNDDTIQSRAWSSSTKSPRPGHRARSLSDGAAMLARTGTLFHPDSSKQRSSAELSLMLGNNKRRLSQGKLLPPPDQLRQENLISRAPEKIRLEASKKSKARVEVDVVLEKECVVEGGEVRGRMEVLIRGGKRGEGLRVGAGKVRVLGFEDVSASSRHIFYHYQHTLPLFEHPSSPGGPSSSLFGSPPDDEGYRLAVEGMHSIPFRVRLPLDGGAKGSYSSQGKGPCVRYVVVGSVKIHIPSSGKRAIAHFYRPIIILPYLNPSIILAPSHEPVEVKVESGLGWSLTGEKGRVEVKVALGRRIWVCGQRAWCEISIRNDSNKKINKIAMALLQTVSVFDSTSNEVETCTPRRPQQILERSSDLDNSAPTSTQRRKVIEEITEADFTDHGSGRITSKGWWTGVEPGERGQWDMSLQIPIGMVSIRRSRLIEVSYLIRVTINNSIYLDVPIELINFLSMDPPPMPGDCARFFGPIHQQQTQTSNQLYHVSSNTSMNSARLPARASSTTLHVDALLQQGQARAQMTPQTERSLQNPDGSRSRPLSMGSAYSLDRARSEEVTHTSFLSPDHSGAQSGLIPTRPGTSRVHSYLSSRSDSVVSDDEEDKALMEARRREGRQLSLAAIRAATSHHGDSPEAETGDQANSGEHDNDLAYRPDQTPSEEQYKLADTPSFGAETDEGRTPLPPSSIPPQLDVVDELADVMDMVESNGQDATPESSGLENLDTWNSSSPGRRRPSEVDVGENEMDEGGRFSNHLQARAAMAFGNNSHRDSHYTFGAGTSVDSGGSNGVGQYMTMRKTSTTTTSDIDDGSRGNHTHPNHYQIGELGNGIRSMSINDLVPPPTLDRSSRMDSYATSAASGSELESEIGQVYEATRNEIPSRFSRLVPLDHSNSALSTHIEGVNTPPSTRVRRGSHSASPLHIDTSGRRGSHTPSPTSGSGVRRDSDSPTHRRGSVPNVPSSLRRESGSSPLRQQAQLQQQTQDGLRSSFSLSPSNLRVASPLSPSTSPRSLLSQGLFEQQQGRRPSTSSQLRNEIQADPTPPALAPSVASDSATSEEGHLESPPITHDSWPASPRIPETVEGTLSSINHSPPVSPSTESVDILPGMRSKIAQLESRDEALRKFSVASSAGINQAAAATDAATDTAKASSSSQPNPYAYISEEAQSPSVSPGKTDLATGLAKRQSYTAALAPRPIRSTSDDADNRMGYTTFTPRKSFACRESVSSWRHEMSPPGLNRTLSVSSTSTTATEVERALMRSPPQSTPKGPRPLRQAVLPPRQSEVQAQRTPKSYGYDEFGGGLSVPDVREEEIESYGSTGWRGGFRLPPLTFASGSVAEESEESEGLL